jgi:hypothetical protein
MERDTEDYIMQLEKRLVLLEGRVAMLEARLAGVTPVPTRPVTPSLQQNCSVCGITFIDSLGRPITLGYACNRVNCPSGVRYATQNYGAVWADNATPDLEPHLKSIDIQWNVGSSTTSYTWDPIKQGNKKI